MSKTQQLTTQAALDDRHWHVVDVAGQTLGHWLLDTATHRATGRTVGTEVTFVDATDQEIADYVATGEPLWVAGAFTLEGRAGPLIAGIHGDPSNVIGLSLPALRTMLQDLGHELRDVATHAAAGDSTP